MVLLFLGEIDVKALIERSLQEGIELRQACLGLTSEVEAAGRLLILTLAEGGRLLWCGNGGSAADCQHIAAELVGRFERDNSLPALALTTDTSILTAVANDFGFEQVFARQVRALGRKGDCLVAISTSGNSPNVVAAAQAARVLGLRCLALTGQKGGQLEELADLTLRIPSTRTCRIQEMHLSLGHIWCEMIEAARERGQLP